MGITGEIAEYEAAKFLGVKLSPSRTEGFDGHLRQNNQTARIQIKGRRFENRANPGARVGALNLEKEWDVAALVLLDEMYDATEIFVAERLALKKELERPGSRSRNERGQISISQFKRAAGRTPVWSR